MADQPDNNISLLIQMLRDLQIDIKSLPSRAEFNALLMQIREYVTKDKHESDIARVESRTVVNAKDIAALQKESADRPRLGSWAVWFVPSFITTLGILINIFITHPALPTTVPQAVPIVQHFQNR